MNIQQPAPADSGIQPMLELDEVTKRYSGSKAVDGVSVSINAGEFVTLLGPSGSGKTTCLRIIAGMISPDEGRLRIAGRDVSRTPMNKRNIGMVFQNYSLFPHMTVAQNVAYPLRVRGGDRRGAQTAIEQALSLVRLEGFGGRRPDQLSGGQQQRVALARALVFKPDVLLLDEPLSALDRVLREGMQLELRRIHESTGTTMVCVTHDRSEALTMSDRIIVLRDGKIIQDGAPEQIYTNSNSRFVAEFLGETNVLQMNASRSGHTVQLKDVAGRTLTLTDEAGRVPAGLADVVFRVENISVSTVDDKQNRREWLGVVSEAVFLGDAVRYVIECAPHTITARVPIQAVSTSIVRGSKVSVGLNPQTAMVFSPGT